MSVRAISGKKDILSELVRLAKDKRLMIEKYSTDDGSTITEIYEFLKTPAYKKIQEKENALEDFMMSLDFEDIKMIQTLMYLGRDREYNEKDNYEKRYLEFYSMLNRNGWNTKEIEINQMTEKTPLDQYIQNGLVIIGVKI